MLSEERLRDVLAIKERIAGRMEKCHQEMAMLEKEAAVLDEILLQSSFTKASSLPSGGQAAPPKPEEGPGGETVKLVWKQKQTQIGSALVTPGSISITIDGSVHVDADTPPFKSFFVDKVIAGMRKKDLDDGLEPVDCAVDVDGREIRSITVTGYRDASRVREIINTAEWSLNRMLERAAE